MSDILPPLRTDLELFPFEHQGQRMFLVRDPLGLVPEGRAIPSNIARVLAMLDGTRTMADLQADLTRANNNVLVGQEFLETMLGELDATYLLASERYTTARQEIVDRYSALPARPTALAGTGYPADPGELAGFLDVVLASAGQLEEIPDWQGPIKALAAPHIDLNVGGPIYGRAYGALRSAVQQGFAPERVVVLGVGHQLAEDMYSIGGKAYATPLGEVPADGEAVARLRDAGKKVAAADDFAHRSEHSIEFQVLFLQHLLPKDSFSLIPILCGFIGAGEPGQGPSRASYQETAGPFLAELRDILADPKTLLVAGIDFSHIGPKFGHREEAGALEQDASAHDQALLEKAGAMDADGFWAESRRVQDRFNVCGFTALACLLEVLPPCKGRVLGYSLWHEEPTHSAVGFAAAGWSLE